MSLRSVGANRSGEAASRAALLRRSLENIVCLVTITA
jgi:hypothetical protein